MNGTEPKIEIIKPFGEAFELMKKILFQPFELRKWFVIGFAAWLSHLGGGNYNFQFNRGSDWQSAPGFQAFRETINQIPHWLLVSGLIALVTLIVGLVIVFAWLRARGRFMFIDCVLKNRGAIVEPWREFRRQGNSYFLFVLLIGLIMMFIACVAVLPFLVPFIRGVTFRQHEAYFICMIALWAVVLFFFVFAWALISHFMVPVMYRRRCRAGEGFRAAVSLIAAYPGEITLYCLFWIALAIASVVVGCATILATCCIALIPYIGTVVMLPIFVCLRAFGLLFLRQFGPDYDVWAGISETLPPPVSPPPPPLPN